MTTSTAGEKAHPLDGLAWSLKVRRLQARNRELRDALLEARGALGSALLTIEGLRAEVVGLEGIIATLVAERPSWSSEKADA